jgi:hypothetical protein
MRAQITGAQLALLQDARNLVSLARQSRVQEFNTLRDVYLAKIAEFREQSTNVEAPKQPHGLTPALELELIRLDAEIRHLVDPRAHRLARLLHAAGTLRPSRQDDPATNGGAAQYHHDCDKPTC